MMISGRGENSQMRGRLTAPLLSAFPSETCLIGQTCDAPWEPSTALTHRLKIGLTLS